MRKSAGARLSSVKSKYRADDREVDQHPGNIDSGCERRRGNHRGVKFRSVGKDREQCPEHGGAEDLRRKGQRNGDGKLKETKRGSGASLDVRKDETNKKSHR